MIETCSCGARFEHTRVEGTGWPLEHVQALYEIVKDWRKNHRHEFTAEAEGQPMIDVAGALVERAPQYISTENDIPFGFTRNETR